MEQYLLVRRIGLGYRVDFRRWDVTAGSLINQTVNVATFYRRDSSIAAALDRKADDVAVCVSVCTADRHRPYLMTRVQGTNDYINAVFVDVCIGSFLCINRVSTDLLSNFINKLLLLLKIITWLLMHHIVAKLMHMFLTMKRRKCHPRALNVAAITAAPINLLFHLQILFQLFP